MLQQDGFWYYNPSSEAVKQMVVGCVTEVLKKYDVDGIHFDDYFYPGVDDGGLIIRNTRNLETQKQLPSGGEIRSVIWWRVYTGR